MNVIIVHGSVETSCDPLYLDSLQQAAITGYAELEKGLIDAVEKTIMVLEDDPLFNAGFGSVLNLDGEVEMDAAIMDGLSYRCGAVAGIKGVRNPVCVARKVMEETSHVLLVGNGANRFAAQKGFLPFDPVTKEQKQFWEKAIAGEIKSFSPFTGLPKSCDTVGCIAVCDGNPAAASSTGGSFLKLPGRVGDTPVIGGGIYASPYGAAVCTGLGEAFIRLQGAAWAVNLISQGVSVHDAAKATINRLKSINANGGILVVDNKANVAAVHNSNSFPLALVRDGQVIKDFEATRIA
ncbi:isoaspartyl peptidase/L-asparaginase family protein [Desulfotruncus alcoholivorax]|uniref:isoaspartyl peptidase/L-asparaginase family protein n=1 Tax=Desulfotruncus alcoholivorax TaxID=265477 RepID=UPI0004075B13|nr:isoaspartyl peptidase/L-asparaginase family protein [Desulfotruncus alcoholivorax]